MKPLILTLLACATSALAQMPLVHLPIDTNSLVGTSTPFWLSNPPPAYVAAYQVYQAVEENNKRIENAFGGLSDTQTNGIVNSHAVPVWSTNSVSIAAGGTNYLPVALTGFCSISYDVTAGAPVVLYSFDQVTWIVLKNDFRITNAPIWLCFAAAPVESGMIPTPVPTAAAVANVVIYEVDRTDLIGRINSTVGQIYRPGAPLDPRDCARLKDVTDAVEAAELAASSRTNDLYMNGRGLHPTPNWNWCSETNSTSQSVCLDFLGDDVLQLKAYNPTFGHINIAWNDGGTTIGVVVSTNGLVGEPHLMYSHYVTGQFWRWIPTTYSSYPSVGAHGTNIGYILKFSQQDPDQGYVRAAINSTNPPEMNVSGSVSATNYYLFSPNGTRFKLQVSDAGVLSAVAQ